jgi:FPC/CPF motif-containing protein YcgG
MSIPSECTIRDDPQCVEGVTQAFEDLVLEDWYPCVGAKSAVRRGNAWIAPYGRMGSHSATAGVARDLRAFVARSLPGTREMRTFVACFDPLDSSDELTFEHALWATLQRLADIDAEPWDPAVQSDPEHKDFSFSFGGRAFFVVGLHPGASRLARRFAWPALVFNLHDQFDRLRVEGRYERMQKVIRDRDIALQGETNPMLGDFGRRSEARQYAGRQVDPDWSCPFHGRRVIGEP